MLVLFSKAVFRNVLLSEKSRIVLFLIIRMLRIIKQMILDLEVVTQLTTLH